MRHHNTHRKFGRERDQREAFIQSLAVALIKEEKITTTLARAKEIRPTVEKMVTLAQTATLSHRRALLTKIGTSNRTLVKKMFDTIAPRYADRKGGYLRIVKLPRRVSDASPMARIEFV